MIDVERKLGERELSIRVSKWHGKSNHVKNPVATSIKSFVLS